MALTHTTAIRNGLADYVVDAIDGGAGDANGDIVIMTSGLSEIVTLSFSNPAFFAAAAGVATAEAIADGISGPGGTAAIFKVQNLANVEIFRGMVSATGGGGDMQLSSTSIGAGDTVTITSFTYTSST